MKSNRVGNTDLSLAEWFEIANVVEAALDRAPSTTRADILHELHAAGIADWTILPGGEPGDCRRFLLAMIDSGPADSFSEEDFRSVLQRRLEQVRVYLKRIGASMDGVMLFLDQSHFLWRGGWRSSAYKIWCETWCQFRAILMAERPDIHIRVVFADPEYAEHEVCHFGVDGSPVGGRRLLQWWCDAEEGWRSRLRERILLVRHLGMQADFNCKYADARHRAYENIYSSAPALEFGGSSRRAQAEWRCAVRLHLNPALDLPLVFDGRRYNWEHRMEIHSVSSDRVSGHFFWRPADMRLFSMDPGLWLTQGGAYY